MKNSFYSYTRLTHMTAFLKSQKNFNMQSLHGRLVVDTAERRLFFQQASPRGPRSREVMRTDHSRLVRRPDGTFTLTFRFALEEEELRKQLLREMLQVCTVCELIEMEEAA